MAIGCKQIALYLRDCDVAPATTADVIQDRRTGMICPLIARPPCTYRRDGRPPCVCFRIYPSEVREVSAAPHSEKGDFAIGRRCRRFLWTFVFVDGRIFYILLVVYSFRWCCAGYISTVQVRYFPALSITLRWLQLIL